MDINIQNGIHTNSPVSQTPEGFYRDAMNIRSSQGVRRTEEGTFSTQVPADVIPYGNCAIGSETVIIGLKNNKTVIGILKLDDTWEEKIYREVDVIKVTGPVQMEGRKNWAGERLIYFSTAEGSRRINLDQDLSGLSDELFNKVTALFLKYTLPKPSYLGENTTGNLKSGVYQFAVRLVTDSLSETPFGISTGVIPVVPGNLGDTRDNVVGAPPQTDTTKSINLQITDIDSAFKYIQIGVLTYVGLANTPVVHVSNLIAINNRTSINYTYTGDSDNLKQILLEEFIVSGVNYESGEFFTQKDGTLLVGAPKEANLPPIDWHRVAQNIVSRYTVKEIPYAENLSFDLAWNFADVNNANSKQKIIETSSPLMDESYKNPLTCEKFKGYRRNEVYAFTLTPVFTSGVLGPTVHIPANFTGTNTGSTPTVELDPNDGGMLGVFVSEELYEDDRYPNIPIGYGLRLHKFPTAVQQPLISGSVDTNNLKIRVLGVNFSNITLAPSEEQYSNLIEGFIIGRLNRTNQETQLAQGIVRPNTSVRFQNNDNYAKCISVGDGNLEWLIDTADGGTATACYPTTKDLTSFTFLSPDLIHNVHSESEASHIYQHSAFTCNPYTLNNEFGSDPVNVGLTSMPNIDVTTRSKVFFKNITGQAPSGFTIDQTLTPLSGSRVRVAPFGIPLQPASKGGKNNTTIIKDSESLKLCSSDGFSWFNTLNNENIKLDKNHDYLYKSEYLITADTKRDKFYFVNRAIPNYRASFVLHSLQRSLPKQYGTLDQMVSMPVMYQSWKEYQELGTETTTTTVNSQTNVTSETQNPLLTNSYNSEIIGSSTRVTIEIILPTLDWVSQFDTRRNVTMERQAEIGSGNYIDVPFYDILGVVSGFNHIITLQFTVPTINASELPTENDILYLRTITTETVTTTTTVTTTVGPSIEFYGGDTFISKYGLTINDEAYFPYLSNDSDNGINDSKFARPANANGVIYFWLESVNNYNFRHYIEPESFSSDNSIPVGSVPYFPDYKVLANYEAPFGICSMVGDAFKRTGYASQYNNQYSAQPNIKPFAITPKEDIENRAVLKNRILYSAQSVQGEKADAYQIFLPNNYYDVPMERGFLTDIYVNQELYASTAEIQWLLFFNSFVTQATSAGEVVLGTGGAFNRPAVPLQTVDGGFGGTSHWTHAVSTPFGRVFVDKLQGLIFFAAENLEIVSRTLSSSYKTSLRNLSDDAIRLGSEPLHRRVFIRLGTEMYSLDTESKFFISRHSIMPRWMFSHNSHMYSTREYYGGVHKHGVGNSGYYYGVRQNSYITVVANQSPKVSKFFKSLELVTKGYSNTGGIYYPFKTIDELETWTDEQYSGANRVILKQNAFQDAGVLEVLANKVKNSFRLVVPRDIVKDLNFSIFDTSNHLQVIGDTTKTKWLKEFKNNYLVIKLTMYNTTGTVIIESISVDVAENIR